MVPFETDPSPYRLQTASMVAVWLGSAPGSGASSVLFDGVVSSGISLDPESDVRAVGCQFDGDSTIVPLVGGRPIVRRFRRVVLVPLKTSTGLYVMSTVPGTTANINQQVIRLRLWNADAVPEAALPMPQIGTSQVLSWTGALAGGLCLHLACPGAKLVTFAVGNIGGTNTDALVFTAGLSDGTGQPLVTLAQSKIATVGTLTLSAGASPASQACDALDPIATDAWLSVGAVGGGGSSNSVRVTIRAHYEAGQVAA